MRITQAQYYKRKELELHLKQIHTKLLSKHFPSNRGGFIVQYSQTLDRHTGWSDLSNIPRA